MAKGQEQPPKGIQHRMALSWFLEEAKRASQAAKKRGLVQVREVANALFGLLVVIYGLSYPPSNLSSVITPELRLGLESFLLAVLAGLYLTHSPLRLPLPFLFLLPLTFAYWLWGGDEAQQVFSFFNKLAFLLLLYKVCQVRSGFVPWLRRWWLVLWVYFGLAAPLAALGYMSHLVPFRPWSMGAYNYHLNPLLGTIMLKKLGPVVGTRYVGWFFEPVFTGFFFGINYFLGSYLIGNEVWVKRFKILMLLGGFLTLSMGFVPFFALYFFWNLVLPPRLRSPTIALLIALALAPVALKLYLEPDLLKFSSLGDRVWRFSHAWKVAQEASFQELFFGMGIVPFFDRVGGGVAGLPNLLLGRGFLIGVFLLALLIRLTKFDRSLLLFILYYNLIFDLFYSPLFLMGVVVAYQAHFYKYWYFHSPLLLQKGRLSPPPLQHHPPQAPST